MVIIVETVRRASVVSLTLEVTPRRKYIISYRRLTAVVPKQTISHYRFTHVVGTDK